MRDLINLLDSVLLAEKSRGLLYRTPGDSFFQGSVTNPTAQIVFRDVEYFPAQPGAYDSYEEMAAVGEKLGTQYPQGIIWTNKPQQGRSRAFAILTFDGPGKGQTTSYGRFFSEIKPDMTGAWGNDGLPGGWQLNKQTSLKGRYYRLKPSDLFPPDSRFASPSDCVAAIGSNPSTSTPGQIEAISKIRPGMEQLLSKKWPVFQDVGAMVTAIRDDLGETIGPIALIQGMIQDAAVEKARQDILGPQGAFAGSSIFFPASKINGLVDSYITTPGGIEIGLSSKGEKGATASVKNIADGVDTARKKGMTDLLEQYAAQVEVIERVGKLSSRDLPLVLGQEQGLITKPQAAAILKLIDSGAKTIDAVSIDPEDRQALEKYMDQYKPKKDNPKYNVGYHVLAVLAKEVLTNINRDPVFGSACLKFLNVSPIIQLHLQGRETPDSYQVTGFTAKYPPDFQGTVALDASKVYAATGTNGRVTFAYNPTTDAEQLVSPADEPGDSDAPAAAAAVDADFEMPRSKIKASGKTDRSPGDEQTLGRKRRS